MKIKNIIISIIVIFSLLNLPVFPNNYSLAQESENIGLSPPSIIRHKPVGEFLEGDVIPVIAIINNNGKLANAVLYYRPEGREKYYSVAMNHIEGNEYIAKIPQSETDTNTIEYYIEVTEGVFSVTTTPQIIQMEKPLTANEISALRMIESGDNASIGAPFYKKWWFWTIVGAVLIGAAASVNGGDGDSADKNAKPATVNTVNITAASP